MRKKERIIKAIKIIILLLILMAISMFFLNIKKIANAFSEFATEEASNFYIQFDKILSEEPETEEIEEKIIGINLEEDKPYTYKDIVSYQEGINDFFQKIGDKDYYYKNFSNLNNYYSEVKDKLTGDYYYALVNKKTDSVISKAMNDIYKIQNCYYWEANIIGIGKTLENTYLEVEIVAVGDITNFYTQILKLYLDKYNRISNVEKLNNIHESVNTTTPLGKESILYNTHESFLENWNKIKDKLKNPTIYQEFSSGEDSNVTYKINTLIDSVEVDNKDYDIIKQIFIDSKGTFENCGFIEYHIQDIDLSALTIYTLKFNKNTYEITYNRLTNKIENINLKQTEN